ncbi:hypothetical protein TNCT_444201 [Trichonephila clavata]|uniref:Secreted protein n=1 Tax=Trichonephila clavata TaxID=2740835 RepID=A0A8X6GS98_TRICU|nr:hypothetical protein TNCT_444201 [Trichonephila clavata]
MINHKLYHLLLIPKFPLPLLFAVCSIPPGTFEAKSRAARQPQTIICVRHIPLHFPAHPCQQPSLIIIPLFSGTPRVSPHFKFYSIISPPLWTICLSGTNAKWYMSFAFSMQPPSLRIPGRDGHFCEDPLFTQGMSPKCHRKSDLVVMMSFGLENRILFPF